MNKEQKIALLNKWGVNIPENADEAVLDKLIEAGKPAPKTEPAAPANSAGLDDAIAKANAATAAANKLVLDAKRRDISNRVAQMVEADKIPAGQMNEWIEEAVNAADSEKVLNRLDALPSRPPGVSPLNITVGDSTSVEDLNKAANRLLAPQDHVFRNRRQADREDRETIGRNAKAINAMINRLDKRDADGVLIGPLRAMYDAWASSPRNANTMDTGLLRQVVLSEVMRAFKRRLAPLSFFAHNYQSVPLEGTDTVNVPYYPLDTTASSDFDQSTGYSITPGSVTSSKSIVVWGGANASSGNKPNGSGRKYKGLQFSAYEMRRYPWLNIQQLTVMAGEQLALDVLNDIITAYINQTNYGSAVFTGPKESFTADAVANIMTACNQADWPEMPRNMVLDSAYYGELTKDPAVKSYLQYGGTEVIREGKIAGLYGFQNTVQNPRIPTTGDANLKGFACYPSAILVATAPIMPAPGEMLRMVSFDTVVDDQTGLAINYKYWGDPKYSADYEIIESAYGSGKGELGALKRIVSSGT